MLLFLAAGASHARSNNNKVNASVHCGVILASARAWLGRSHPPTRRHREGWAVIYVGATLLKSSFMYAASLIAWDIGTSAPLDKNSFAYIYIIYMTNYCRVSKWPYTSPNLRKLWWYGTDLEDQWLTTWFIEWQCTQDIYYKGRVWLRITSLHSPTVW